MTVRRLGPRTPTTARYPEVETFGEVAGGQVTEVALPPAPAPTTWVQTVQPAQHPALAPAAGDGARHVCVAVIPSGRVLEGAGAVIDGAGRLVLESLWDREHWRRSFDPPKAVPPATPVPGRHATLLTLWADNYYHWLFDALPRLAVLEASGLEYDRLIVPERLNAFQRQTLELLGYPAERLLPCTGGHLVVDELVWPSPHAFVGRPSPFAAGWLKERLGGGGGTPERRVYVGRASRGIANERAVLRRLAPLGFETVEPADMTEREQVGLFAETAVMIGPHGAAFANTIFSDHLDALELYQPAHVNGGMAAALAAAGHHHWSLVGTRAPGLAARRHQGIQVPLDDLDATLAAMGLVA